MDAVKVRKPKMSERNQIVWTEPNFKFVREHSISRPKPSWLSAHPKNWIAAILVLFVVFIVMLFSEFVFFRIPITIVCAALSLFVVIDTILAAMRVDKFHLEHIKRGGEVINPWNARTLKTSKNGNVIATIMLVVYIAFITVAFLMDINGENDSFILFYSIYLPIMYSTFSFGQITYSPYIFMDIDEGMLFGDALFPYDIMSGLKPTGNGNGFELYYDGKKVAYGRMLPDDMNYLQEILALRSKYKDYL